MASNEPNPEYREAVLRALRDGPLTRRDLRLRTGVPMSTVNRHLKRLLREGAVVRWAAARGETDRIGTSLWGFASDRPAGAKESVRDMVIAAARTPGSVRELSARTGLNEATTRLHVKALVRAGAVKRSRARYRATGGA